MTSSPLPLSPTRTRRRASLLAGVLATATLTGMAGAVLSPAPQLNTASTSAVRTVAYTTPLSPTSGTAGIVKTSDTGPSGGGNGSDGSTCVQISEQAYTCGKALGTPASSSASGGSTQPASVDTGSSGGSSSASSDPLNELNDKFIKPLTAMVTSTAGAVSGVAKAFSDGFSLFNPSTWPGTFLQGLGKAFTGGK
jgi:hypothetical protein